MKSGRKTKIENFMNLGKVTIVIPNYNQEQFISQAIQSALSQTMPADEIIVIDDGSTDGSSDVIKGFGDRIRYIWQENKGLAGARNTGIRAAQGELIALLDADDEWLPTYLEKMVGLANHNPEASVYYCRAQAIDVEGRPLPQIFGGPPLLPEVLYNTLLRANFIIPSTILMRRSIVIQAGLFDQGLRSCEDWDLWLRLLPTHKIIGINDILVCYRIHGSSLSTNPAGMQRATRLVVEKHFGADDGNPETWSPDKRRAYGGMYRYHTITSILRQGDWKGGAQYLIEAFKIDPSLSKDLGLYYDLALGTQPPGYRATNEKLTFNDNIKRVNSLLDVVFHKSLGINNENLRRKAYGTANYAMGLLAYNLDQRKLCRRLFLSAIVFRPELFINQQLVGNLIKSNLSRSSIEQFKKLVRKTNASRAD